MTKASIAESTKTARRENSGRLLNPREVLLAVLEWSRDHEYSGYSKHDALNSPLLHAVAGHRKIPRLVATQAVMRFPWNIRPVVGVPKARNPKGIGLFAHACLDLACYYRCAQTADREWDFDRCVAEADRLLGWLVRNPSPWTSPSMETARLFGATGDVNAAGATGGESLRGLGWGYHYDWQDRGFFQRRGFPNRVVTSWIGFAFLKAFEVTGREKYLAVCREIAEFLLANPGVIVDDDRHLCLAYLPLADVTWAVMDVSALVSAFCAGLASHGIKEVGSTGNLADNAKKLMAFVVDKQTAEGAWFYTWPAGDSHIRHDNYHTGIILDCLEGYMSSLSDTSCEDAYRTGLDYYERNLFLANGAPRWMNDRTYPMDVHGAAAGSMAFARAAEYFGGHKGAPESRKRDAYLDLSDRILQWSLHYLYSGRGYFYYQRTPLFTKRFCLMRWCNAWMCRAMARILRIEAEGRLPQTAPSETSPHQHGT